MSFTIYIIDCITKENNYAQIHFSKTNEKITNM
jgi:hypothetical protein